jgi:dihydrofolate reductase
MTLQRTWKGMVFIGASLDGKIARPNDEIDWLTDPPTDHDHAPAQAGPSPPPDYTAFMADVDHVVMGRRTYQKVLTFGGWPYSSKQVVVLSSTLGRSLDDRVTVTGTIEETLDVLGQQEARGVYLDGGRLIQEFLRRGLVDEIIIGVAPVLIGDGIPLFGSLPRDIRLTHLGTSYGDSGMISSRYRVNH